MMERLTVKFPNGYLFKLPSEKDEKAQEEFVNKLSDKLGEYEDLEEQGLLLQLPVLIGTTVYSVTRDFISEYTICSIEKYNEGFFFNWKCEKGIYINVRGFTEYDIGKTVFLTKAEAEQKLKEIQNNLKDGEEGDDNTSNGRA